MINRSAVWFDKIITSLVTGNMKTNHRFYCLTGAKHLECGMIHDYMTTMNNHLISPFSIRHQEVMEMNLMILVCTLCIYIYSKDISDMSM